MNTIQISKINNASAIAYNEELGDWENVKLEQVRSLVASGVKCEIDGRLIFNTVEDEEEFEFGVSINYEVNAGQIHFSDRVLYENLEVEYSEEESNNNYEAASEMLEELY